MRCLGPDAAFAPLTYSANWFSDRFRRLSRRRQKRSDTQGVWRAKRAVFTEAFHGEPPQPFRMALLSGSGGVVSRKRSQVR